ncbi:MAG TPA: sugar phosphate isomerase/epimerase [Candidatus Enterocloster faecavium]|uniref:Sugar phosphate isomerase/epimerase n=1 Tax=Candidatus Enterocloster faecavium TaxID=2838560 RepID=A0A9D2LA65_9FIRM|nr:sugar phosphate isomerase/epimerase [Candidatus Enterocloster faecavium]
MATIYLCSTLLWNGSLEEIFDMACQSGLDGIELWAQHFFHRKFDAGEFEKLAALYPLKSCVHSQSWDLNLASMNEGIRKQSVIEVEKSIDLAYRLGLDEVTVHPGRCTIPGTGAPYEAYLRQSFQEILEYAKKRQIDVSLEIMEKIPKEFVTTMDAMKRVCGDLFDQFVYTLDVAHCDSEEEVLTTLQDYRPHISKLHISNRKGPKFHTPLNEGDYDMEKLLPRLARYDLPMVIEGLDSSRDFSTAKQNIQFIQHIFNGGNQDEKEIRSNFNRRTGCICSGRMSEQFC